MALFNDTSDSPVV
uniref:Uncharacterized protein n=1 Tax=Arundo donax TaxID=35708 RepID=A0A0A8ZU15_ARUDO